MHIAEGVLSAPVLITGAVVAAGAVAYGLKKLDPRQVMMAAILGAAFFVASLIHIPVGPSSVHLLLNGLLGVLLGWSAVPVIFVGLLLQAILYGFGGLTVLGVNTATMGLGAVLSWYIFGGLLSVLKPLGAKKAAAVSGFVSGVAIAAILTALALAFTDEGFKASALMLLAAHLPVMLIEGIVTAVAVSFIARVRPALLPEATRLKLADMIPPAE